MKTVIDITFLCFRFWTDLLWFDSFEKIEIKYLWLRWLCLNNSQLKSDIVKALMPTRPGKNSKFLYLWTNVGCYSWWELEPYICNLPNSSARFWRLEWLLQAYCCESHTKSWLELSFLKNGLSDVIGQSLKSADFVSR